MKSPVLIYDAECPYCRSLAGLTSMLSEVDKINYRSERAQKLLEEEFEDPGFTLYLFEDEKVYFGDQAARRASEHLKIPSKLSNIVVASYPYLVKLFSVLSGRSGVGQPVCDEEKCIRKENNGGIKARET